MIITWGGNTPAWNQKLHLNAIRIGCSSAPSSCVQAAQQIANVQHVSRAFLAIRLTPSIGEEGRQYSASSKAAPALYSIGFDDFLSQMERLHTSESHIASMLSAFIEGLKSQNSGLHFGVTVYENELSSPELTSRAMAQVRNQTNFVHLFIHYRVDGPNFATYVRQAKAIFPNAQIIAGSYPVDRIDYLPCSRNQHVACTSSQEISLFKKSFDVQLHLLQDGSVAGIEFYPGDFGNVARSDIWGSPRSCRPGRLPECIANSKQMRKYVGEKLSQFSF
ncbi:MAG: hypothetical protein ACRD4R_08480 [Candidatus Acidiferrales bacterium]